MITFGELFTATENIFEALSGTCKTAKKYGVVDYDAEQLWQGANDQTIITLLKNSHSGVKVPRRRRAPPSSRIAKAATGAGFGESNFKPGVKCASCKTAVYAMEYIGVGDHAFHRNCFKCNTCRGALRSNDYCVSSDGAFRCAAHHRDFELARSLAPVTHAIVA